MQLKEIVNFLKKNKPLVFILLLILLVSIKLIFDVASTIYSVQTPVVKNNSPKSNKKELIVVSVSPPSGNRSTLDSSETISFEFSVPVVIDSLDYTVSPSVNFNVLYSEDFPNRITFLPKDRGWLPNVSYVFKILTLQGVSGEEVISPIIYEYINTPPDVTKNPLPF